MEHYKKLLFLYERMEELTSDISAFLSQGSNAFNLTENLKVNMQVAEQIQGESKKIVEMKKNLLENDMITEIERKSIHEIESVLAGTVNRLIEQESKNREMMMKSGIKISRR
jgi:hypothetical protein